jgi:hypothetical protein
MTMSATASLPTNTNPSARLISGTSGKNRNAAFGRSP